MKRTLLFIPMMIAAMSGMTQQTITSTTNGNATNPFVWDCICIPQPADSVVIAHNITMDADWYSSGAITVISGASFIEDAQNRAILFDNGGALYNYGSTELTNVSFTNGGHGYNNGAFTVDSGLYVGPPSYFENLGAIYSLDSLLVSGTWTNGPNASVAPGDIYVNGTFNNNGGMVQADSLLNEGVFTSSGYIYATEWGNTGSFDNTGLMQVNMNFYNVGFFSSSSTGEVEIGIDFWNADTINGTAIVTNDGLFEIAGDWYNGDTLNGTNGYFCIAGSTANAGNVIGSVDICDGNGGGIDTQIGVVGPNVTFCSTPCGVGIDEFDDVVRIYPNPAESVLNIESSEVLTEIRLVDLSGRTVMVLGGNRMSIDVSTLAKGTYVLQLTGENGSKHISKVLIR